MAAYCHEDCLGGDGSGSLKNEPQRARKCALGKNEKFLWPNDSPLRGSKASRRAGERMKSRLLFVAVAAGCLALSGPARARLAQGSKEKPAGETQVIEVTARKYEFAPAEIHVTKGSRVQLNNSGLRLRLELLYDFGL